MGRGSGINNPPPQGAHQFPLIHLMLTATLGSIILIFPPLQGSKRLRGPVAHWPTQLSTAKLDP